VPIANVVYRLEARVNTSIAQEKKIVADTIGSNGTRKRRVFVVNLLRKKRWRRHTAPKY